MIKYITLYCMAFTLCANPVPSLLRATATVICKNIAQLEPIQQKEQLAELQQKLTYDSFYTVCLHLFYLCRHNTALWDYLKETEQWDMLLVDCSTPEGEFPIHMYAAVNDPLGVDYVIRRGSKVDARTHNGQTPLHYAAAHNAAETLLFLPGYMATAEGGEKLYINMQDENGHTALHEAVRNGASDAVKTLLSLGASIDTEDSEGHTPLSCALFAENEEIFRILLRHAHLNSSKLRLRSAIQNYFNNVREEINNHRMVPFALQLCAEILPPHLAAFITRWKKQSMAIAAQTNDIPMLHALMMVGISPDLSAAGGPPLVIAAENSREEAVKDLLDHGASVHVRDSARNTPLHVGIHSPQVIKMLLESKASVSAQNKQGQTPLLRACLYAKQPEIDTIIQSLLEAHADPQQPSYSGDTPLRVVSQRGLTSTLTQLLSAGAHPNFVRKKKKKIGTLALHAAASAGHADIADVLIHAGADPTIKTRTHQTASRIASRSGFPDLAAQLLMHQQMFLKQRTGFEDHTVGIINKI